MNPEISVVSAIAKNGVIGKNGGLPWERIPIDMARFRRLTIGKTCIMGRKTYESIGRALPDRENIVLSSDPKNNPHDAWHALNFYSAMQLARGMENDIAVIGGHSVFSEVFKLPERIRLHLTIVDVSPKGDTYFPLIEKERMNVVKYEDVWRCENSPYNLEFLDALYDPKKGESK